MRNNDDTSKFVRQQIERTLSIPRLRLASKSLDDAIEKEQKSQRSLVKKTEKNHDALKKIEEKEELLQTYRKEEDALVRRLTQNQETIDQIESTLLNTTKTAEELERRKSLRAEIKKLEEQSLIYELEIKSLSKNAFWAPLFYKLQEAAQVTKDLSPQIDSHKTKIEFEENLLKSLHSLSENKICPVCNVEHREIPDAVQRKIIETQEVLDDRKLALSTLLKDFSPESKELLEKVGFNETTYSQLRDSRKSLMQVRAEVTLKRNTLKSLEISNPEINEKEDSGLIQRFKALSSEIATDTRDLENAGNTISKLRSEIENLNSTLFQSSLLDLTDKKNRIVILQYLREVIELSILKYSEMVRVEVELQASAVFKHIISEKDFTGLSINESFGMDIQRADGGKVDIRSEGTAHIVALSLVAGLIKTAINDGFVLMDTPFGRLDNTHRGNICTWATIANLQIALFMHSGEFDEKTHLAMFGNKIGRRYRIERINSEESKFVVVGRA
jgi:DNA sulfur modification protein DndD